MAHIPRRVNLSPTDLEGLPHSVIEKSNMHKCVKWEFIFENQ